MLLLLTEAALRTFGLGLLVAVAFKLTRRQGGRAEMTAWIAVLSASLAMPILMQWSPDVTVAIPRAVSAPVEIMLPAPDATAAMDMDTDMDEPATPGAVVPWHLIAVGAYLLVAAILLARLASGLILSARLARNATPLPESALRGLDIRMSDRIAAPLAFASTILVPRDYAAWPAFKRDAVLAHEAAHIERGDFYVLVASCINRAVFWFSPLSWWLHDRLAVLAENASDAAAIDTVHEPVIYAEVLFDFAQRTARPSPRLAPNFAIAMARPNTVAGRIERILSGQPLSRRISMKKHLLVFASLLPLVALTAGLQLSAAQSAVAAVAPATAGQQRTVAAFQSVAFSPSGTVDITVGKTQSLSIEANPELLAHITTEVRDGTLYIGRKNDDNWVDRNRGELTVHISLPRLDGVKVSGSGAIKIDGLTGGKTEVGISGSGSLSARGSLDKLDLTISGSGKADIPDLTVEDAKISISGSGKVKINARQSLDAKISGSGDVRYLGTPKITTKISGSGSIDRAS